MRKSAAFSIFAFIVLSLAIASAGAQTPSVVVSSSQILNPALSNNTHHIAVNSIGDVFYEDDGTSTLYELMPGRPTPLALVTGLHGGRSVAVDPANNVYTVNNYDNGNAAIIEIPYSGANGVYPTADISATLSSTNPPICPAQPTVVCQIYGQGGGSVTGYFQQVSDIAFDAAGNLYAVDNHDNVSSGSYNRIVEYPANQIAQHYPSLNLLADELPESTTAQLAVDAGGNVYYADGISNNVYFIPAGSTVPIGYSGPYRTVGAGLKTPSGVAVDAFRNLIVTDTGNNRLVEIPYANAAVQTANQYVVSYTYSANGVAIDPLGHIYYSGYANSHTNINEMTLWSANLGASNVGTASAATTLSFAFNVATTPATVNVLPAGGPFAITSGGTCTAGTAQSQGSSCTVNVTYTPSAAGAQTGAVILSDSTGASIVTAYLYGDGLGAVQSVDPGTVSAIGSGWSRPEGIAVDAAGNVYIADAQAGKVGEYSSGSLAGTIGTGLSTPSGVAVDGAGNVYVADAGNNRVVEVPVVNGALSNAAQIEVQTGTSGVTGISVDAGGNLYIADSGNNRVLRLPNMGGVPNAAMETTVGSATAAGASFTEPMAVATDLAGNVYIAAKDNALEVQALTNAQSILITSLSSPAGIAIDASGSLYIADAGNNRLLRIPNQNGTLNSGATTNVGGGIAAPYSVAIDASGNLYVTDAADAMVDLVNRTEGTLDFGNVLANTASGAETATLANTGNENLVFGSPLYTETGATSVFSVTTPASGGCAAGATLAPGVVCTLSTVFSPTGAGTAQATLAFSSSAADSSSVTLTGTGGFFQVTQLTAAVTSPASGSPVFGQSITVTATLTTAGGFVALGAPTGTVIFSIDGQVQGQPVTISSNGTASITLAAGLTGGIHSATAHYSGDLNYGSSSTTSPAAITVAQLPTANALTLTAPAQNPLSATPGSTVSMASVITPASVPAPTGTVTFLNGSTVLGSAPLQFVTHTTSTGGSYSDYEADFSSTSLPSGTLSIVASYGGDTNYAPSQSSASTLIESQQTFTVTPSTASLTVTHGSSGTVDFTITSLSGFTGIIGVSCSGLPANTSCAFPVTTTITIPNPAPGQPPSLLTNGNDFQLQSGYPMAETVQISTGQVTTEPQPPVGQLTLPWMHHGVPFSLACLLFVAPAGLFSRKLRKKYNRWLLMLLMLGGAFGAVALSGCGNVYFGTTPKGQSTVTVTIVGTSGSGSSAVTVTKTATISLTVQ